MPATPEPTTTKKPNPPRFPWLILVLLLVSIYLFWVLPVQLGEQPVRVEFENPSR